MGGVGSPDLSRHIGDRLERARLAVPLEARAALTAYLELLSRWNQRINLTAFALSPASDDAVDRLIVEPVAAASRIGSGDGRLMDIGSGGGSPALPLRIVRPHVQLTMVESKVRKCAFLREAVRHLGLGGVAVENGRLEALLGRADLREAADVVTLRAVRADAALWATAAAFLRPGGRVLWFTSEGGLAKLELGPRLGLVGVEALLPEGGGQLAVVAKGL